MDKWIVVTNALVCWVEIWFLMKFMTIHSTYKKQPKAGTLLFWWLSAGACVAFLNDEWSGNALGSVLALLEILLFGVCYLEENICHCAFFLAAGLTVISCIDTLVGVGYAWVSKSSPAKLLEYPVERCVLTVLTKLLLVILGSFYFRIYNKRSTYRFEWLELLWALWNGFCVLGFGCMILLSHHGVYFAGMLASCAILLFADLYIYYALVRIGKLADQRLTYELELQEQKMIEKHYDSGRELCGRIRERRHDMQHHIGYLESLVENGEYQAALRYLDNM